MKKFNRKQKIVLRTVYVLLIIAVLFPPWIGTYSVDKGEYSGHSMLFSSPGYKDRIDPMGWIGQTLALLLIGGGLVVALRRKENEMGPEADEKLSKRKERRVVNLKRGFRRLTLTLAIIAGIAGAAFGPVIAHEEYEQSHFKLHSEQDKAALEVTTGPNFRRKQDEVLEAPPAPITVEQAQTELRRRAAQAELDRRVSAAPDARDIAAADTKSFDPDAYLAKGWRPSSAVPVEPTDIFDEIAAPTPTDPIGMRESTERWDTMDLVRVCVLAGLGGGIAGFSAIWLVYLIIWLIYMFIKWLAFGFCDNNRLRSEKT